jgi:putative photosynthetic complex assembly protein
MTHAISQRHSVRGPLLASALLIAATLALTTFSPFGSFPRHEARPLAERQLLFSDRGDGAVVIRDALQGGQIAVIAPAEGGFVRGAMRGLARARYVAGIGPEVPFRLVGWSDGRLTFEDPATGTKLEMAAFGQTNAEVFLRFLSPSEDQR